MAAALIASEAILPKLYVYDNYSFCSRTRAIFGLKNVDYSLVFLAHHDEATPLSKVGAKQAPFLELPSGEALLESADIIRYVDKNYGDDLVLKQASGREDLMAKVMRDLLSLVFPRAVKALLAEFASKKSRGYFENKKGKILGPFDELLAKTPELLAKANAHLHELDGLTYSDRLVDQAGPSYDDLAVFGVLRGLTLVKGIEWPAKLRAFVEYYAEAGDVPLFDITAM